MNAEGSRRERRTFAKTGPLAPRLEQRCSGCDGTGYLRSEEWEEWERRNVRLRLRRSEAEPDSGLPALLDQSLTRHHQYQPAEPRDDASCEDCGGVGTVPTADGEELMAFLRRHLRKGEREAPQ